MIRYFALALAAVLAQAVPANASCTQAPCSPGDQVTVSFSQKPSDSQPPGAPACKMRDDWEKYLDATLNCTIDDDDTACHEADGLFTDGKCQVLAKDDALYIVRVREKRGDMKISPAKDPSKSYWTGSGYIDPAP